MAPKLFTILIIASLVQQFQFEKIIADDQCVPEDVLRITQENSDVLNEKISNSNLSIKQRLDAAKSRIEAALESSRPQNILSDIKKTLDNLKESDCANNLQLLFVTKKLKIIALETKCTAQSAKKVTSLEKKVESAVNKSESIKAKADLVLQNCGVKNSLIGCSLVENCCRQVVIQLTYKADSESIKIDSVIAKVESEQNKCLTKATNEALELQEDVEEGVLACGQGETEESNDSKHSGETGNSKESKESDEENQKTTEPPLETEVSTSSQNETESPDEVPAENNSGVTSDLPHIEEHAEETVESVDDVNEKEPEGDNRDPPVSVENVDDVQETQPEGDQRDPPVSVDSNGTLIELGEDGSEQDDQLKK